MIVTKSMYMLTVASKYDVYKCFFQIDLSQSFKAYTSD